MKKIIAVLISLCLLETAAIGQGIVPSMPVAVTAQQNISSASNPVLNYSNITSFNDAGSPFSVVIIQDLHCHPGVQKNISTILSQLNENYSVKNIFVEGAAGDWDTGWLPLIEDKDFADKAAEILLSDGKLTGSEYFAYKNKAYNLMKGIEDRDIHLKNLQRLASIVESKKDIEAALAGSENDLRKAQEENYSVFNKKLSRLYGRYKAGELDSEKYYKKLLTYARVSQKKDGVFGITVNKDDYSDILEYLEMSSQRNKINVKAVSSQLSSVINELKNTITYNRYNQLVQKTDSFKKTDVLFSELLILDHERIIDIDKYKDLSMLIKSSNSAKHFNPVKMLESERRLLKSLQLAGSLTEKEALIVVLSDLFDNYKDYYSANLSSDGYLYLNSFGIKKYQNFFKENISAANIGALEKYYDLFYEYYETNINRDKIFTKFIEEKLPVLKRSAPAPNIKRGYDDILAQSEEIDIVVCGGFHSSGLEKEFNDRNISYLVITPKVEGDYKIAGTIYENILLDSNPSKHSIALQVLSQTGQSSQFKSIVESMLAQELSKNPGLDVEKFINDTVNKICSVDKTELERNGVKNYRKPFNEGVTVNKDGSININISFEGKEKTENIIIRSAASGDYSASFFGRKYAANAPFWEWVYMMPFSSFIFENSVFQKFIKSKIIGDDDISDSKIKNTLKYSSRLKAVDLLTSVLLISSAWFSPLSIPALAAFIVVRAVIFAASHSERGSHFNMLVGIGLAFAMPFSVFLFFSSLFVPMSLLTFFASALTGANANILLHLIFNVSIEKFIAKVKGKQLSGLSGAEIVEYLKNFSSAIKENSDVSIFEIYEFLMVLKIFDKKQLSAADTVEALKHLKEICGNFADIERDENLVNKILDVFSKKIRWLWDNKEKDLVKYLLDIDENFENVDGSSVAYILLKTFKGVIPHLKEYLADKKTDIKYRIYVYALLKAEGVEIPQRVEKKLAKEALALLKNFDVKALKVIRESNKWLFNEEMKTYISAASLVLSKTPGSIIAFDKEDVFYKTILAYTAIAPYYDNADSSLVFGEEFVMDEIYNEHFLITAAHEIGHKYLHATGFDSDGKDKDAIHELFSDVLSAEFNEKLGNGMEAFFNKFFEKRVLSEFSEKVTESHDTSRSQLLVIKQIFDKNHHNINWRVFLSVLDSNIKKHKSDTSILFGSFIKEVLADYADVIGIKTDTDFTVKRGSILTEKHLEKMFLFDNASDTLKRTITDDYTASFFGRKYSDLSHLWEWIYVLPLSSFIFESSLFQKTIKKHFLHKDISDSKIKHTLKYSPYLKVADFLTTSILFISWWFDPLFVPALIVYILTRAVIFAKSHADRNDHFNIYTCLGVIFASPFAAVYYNYRISIGFSLAEFFSFSEILTVSSLTVILASAFTGVLTSSSLHLVYNLLVGVLRQKHVSKFSETEMMEYIKTFSSRIKVQEINSIEVYDFVDFLKVFNNKQLSFDNTAEALRHLKEISKKLAEIDKNEKVVNKTLDVFSKKIRWLWDNKEKELVKQILEIDESFENVDGSAITYLLLKTFKDVIPYLQEDISDKEVNIKYRIYAYALLRAGKAEIPKKAEKALAEDALALLKAFDVNTFKASYENDKWLFNEEMKVYISAIYVVMSKLSGSIITFDKKQQPVSLQQESDIYKGILEDTSFAPYYDNANASFLFGQELVFDELYNEQFLVTAAHEAGHRYLLYYLVFLRIGAIHEFFADVFSAALNEKLGKEWEGFFNNIFGKKHFPSYSEIVTESHITARSQLLVIKQFFDKKQHRINWRVFLGVLDNNIQKQRFNLSLPFGSFIKDVLADYADVIGIKTNTDFTVRRGSILTEDYLKKMFMSDNSSVSGDEDLKEGLADVDGLPSYAGSIFGRKYAKTSPFWEWVYTLPFSSFIMGSSPFKTFLNKTFLSDMMRANVNSAMRYRTAMKVIDTVTSAFFIAGLFFAPVFVPALIVFALSRTLVFAASHTNKFNPSSSETKVLILLAASAVFTVPFVIALLFFSAQALPLALAVNIVTHILYNRFFAPLLAAKLKNNYLYTDMEIIRYFYDFKERLAGFNKNKKLSWVEKAKFFAMTELFEINNNDEMANRVLPLLTDISHILSDKKKSGYLVNKINGIIAANYDRLDANTAAFVRNYEKRKDSFSFFTILSKQTDAAVLKRVISDSRNDIKYRLYAYALLMRNFQNPAVDDYTKRELLSGAKRLIENFSWEKDLGHISSAALIYNEELQAYITAVYMILFAKNPEFAGSENSDMYDEILSARFDAKYNNADASLSFGKELLKDKDLQSVFPEIVAHELTHIILHGRGFHCVNWYAIFLLFLPRQFLINTQREAAHELNADTGAYLLSVNTKRDPERFLSVFTKRHSDQNFEAFSEAHTATRKQFLDFVNLMKYKGLGIRLGKFSKILTEATVKNKKNNKLIFKDFFFDVAMRYINEEGYMRSSDDYSRRDLVSVEELHGIFKPLVLNFYNSALWEWVYTLPFSTYITRSKIFRKFLSGTIMAGKSEEFKKERMKDLRTSPFIRLIDLLGSAALITSVFTGAGIGLFAAFVLTRAAIFANAHKRYQWKADFGKKMMLAAEFAFFSLPAYLLPAAGGLGFSSFIAFLGIGIPLNVIIHTLFNKYKPGIKILKHFPAASIFKNPHNSDGEKFSYSSIFMSAQDFVKYNGTLFAEGYDDRVNPGYARVSEALKLKLSEKFNVLPDDIVIIGMSMLSAGDILKDASPLLYSFGEADGKYLLRIETNLLDLLQENGVFAEKFGDGVELDSVKDGKPVISNFHNATAFEVKKRLLKKLLSIPKNEDVSGMASQMLSSKYAFSGVNLALLQYIAGGIKLKPEQMKHKALIEYQLFELMGYILQSQAWLSPSGANMQYGYLQKERMPSDRDRYERQLANTASFENIFDRIFTKHHFPQVIKSKEAALYEYFKKRSNIAALFFIPDSLAQQFKHINMTGSDNKKYDFVSAQDLQAVLYGADSERNFTRYLVIDCSGVDDLGSVVGVVNEYNNSVSGKKSIKEVMFYNAKPDDYSIAMNPKSFTTEFIFDFSSLAGDDSIKRLFTKVPALYMTNDEIVADYGSRVDNFTLSYLHMLIAGRESLSLQDARDHAHQLRIMSSDPGQERITEMIGYYEDLLSELNKMNYFDGMRGILQKSVLAYAKQSLTILQDKESSAQNINFVIDEYRTLLNHMLYLKWSDIKDSGYAFSGDEVESLSGVYNSTMRKPVDSSGVQQSQDTLLVTSGMSALSTIAALLSSEGVNRISLGRNLYYENLHMFDQMNAIPFKDKFIESSRAEVLGAVRRSGTEAVFMDLVANSVHVSRFGTEDIPVADIKNIVAGLSKMKFARPFYLCIDNSMYPSFQLADLFDGTDLPDNLNIILYGSMQKMHQRGLEINTAGFITLISNGFKHKETMAKLKDAAAFTSSNPDGFRYTAMQEFLQRNNNLNEHTGRLNKNAEELASVLNEVSRLFGGEFKVIHPSLYSGSQREAWENNLKPLIPFFFIRDEKTDGKGNRVAGFVRELANRLLEEGFYEFVQRDSYGFGFLTTISYDDDIIRFNVGEHSQENKDKITRAMVKTFMNFAGAIKGNEKTVDDLYEVFTANDINKDTLSPVASESLYKFVTDENTLKFLNFAQIIKVVIICERLGKPAPQTLVDNIKSEAGGLMFKFSDAETALLTELLKYMPDMSIKQILDASAKMWISGSPKTEAAAAANLIEMLIPGKTHMHELSDGLPSVLNGKTAAGLLAAA